MGNFLRRRFRLLLGLLLLMLLGYGVLSYFVLPKFWRHHFEHQPSLAVIPKVTHTQEGVPGDPLNVGLVGSEEELKGAMAAAGWQSAQPIQLRSVAGVIGSVLLHRPDPKAPVSNLYLWGRKQDLAFEKEVGPTLKKRHHVRFWQVHDMEVDSRPFWVGAATFDQGLRFSHWTGQILHRIAPDIDAERDLIFESLEKAGQLSQEYRISGLGPTLKGSNGEGDWYFTDGDMQVGVIMPGNVLNKESPKIFSQPALFKTKNDLWVGIKYFLNAMNRFLPKGDS